MGEGIRKMRIPGLNKFRKVACQICGQTGSCIQHKDNEMAGCSLVESKYAFNKNFSLPSYLHYLNGEKRRGKIDESNVAMHQGKKKKKDADLSEVYTSMINTLELTEAHYSYLTSVNCQLSGAQIRFRQYRSFPTNPWNTVRCIHEDTGITDFSGVPGFFKAESKKGKFWSISGRESILIPYRNLKKEVVGFYYRIDNPPNDVEVKEKVQGLQARLIRQPNVIQVHFEEEILFEMELELGETITVERKFKNDKAKINDILGWVTLKKGNRHSSLSSANEEQGTGSGHPSPVHISVPLHRFKAWKTGETLKAKKVWLSTGPLRTDIATDLLHKVFKPEEIAMYGDTFIALPFVNAWKVCLPVLKEMGVEEVNICFDSDVVSNIQVRKILTDCIKELNEKGYHVNMVIWNEKDGKGIDDLMLNNRIPHVKPLF